MLNGHSLIMSDEDNETEYLPPITNIMDPVELLVRQWITKNVEEELGKEFEGLQISYEDLGTLILNCFDTIQAIMLEEIIPEGTIIH